MGDSADLPDPEPDAARVMRPEWLVVIGICTYLGRVPLGQKTGDPKGGWDGWFCPCHGSHYDTAGRVRKNPAPRNLVVPAYARFWTMRGFGSADIQKGASFGNRMYRTSIGGKE